MPRIVPVGWAGVDIGTGQHWVRLVDDHAALAYRTSQGIRTPRKPDGTHHGKAATTPRSRSLVRSPSPAAGSGHPRGHGCGSVVRRAGSAGAVGSNPLLITRGSSASNRKDEIPPPSTVRSRRRSRLRVGSSGWRRVAGSSSGPNDAVRVRTRHEGPTVGGALAFQSGASVVLGRHCRLCGTSSCGLDEHLADLASWAGSQFQRPVAEVVDLDVALLRDCAT